MGRPSKDFDVNPRVNEIKLLQKFTFDSFGMTLISFIQALSSVLKNNGDAAAHPTFPYPN